MKPTEDFLATAQPVPVEPGLVLPKKCLQLEFSVLKAIWPRDAAQRRNLFYKSPLKDPCKNFLGGQSWAKRGKALFLFGRCFKGE